jgi:predicted ATPase
MQSLDLSRRKGAKAWDLRAAIDLAKLLVERSHRQDAKRLLQSALDGFAEGSDTADIKTAKGFLLTL